MVLFLCPLLVLLNNLPNLFVVFLSFWFLIVLFFGPPESPSVSMFGGTVFVVDPRS
jgi:hypothetical protein